MMNLLLKNKIFSIALIVVNIILSVVFNILYYNGTIINSREFSPKDR